MRIRRVPKTVVENKTVQRSRQMSRQVPKLGKSPQGCSIIAGQVAGMRIADEVVWHSWSASQNVMHAFDTIKPGPDRGTLT